MTIGRPGRRPCSLMLDQQKKPRPAVELVGAKWPMRGGCGTVEQRHRSAPDTSRPTNERPPRNRATNLGATRLRRTSRSHAAPTRTLRGVKAPHHIRSRQAPSGISGDAAPVRHAGRKC